MKKSLLLGTRGSRLALIQAEEIKKILLDKIPGLEAIIKVIETEGDSDRTSPLSGFGGRGAFVKSIESALLRGEIDTAVHSLKDLPSTLPDGLVLGAVPVREDPRDVLVSKGSHDLVSLPSGSVIATGSARRKSQILNIRPDISCIGIRGNVETRIRKLDRGDIDAIVLAASGLKRLGFTASISQFLEPELILPAPCQGALGLECRTDDKETLELLAVIDNPDIRCCVDAERVFIASLGMGCHTPVGALAQYHGANIVFSGYVMYGENGKILRKTCNITKKNVIERVRELAMQFRAKIEHG